MRLDSISDASSPNQTKFTAEGLGLGLWAYPGGTSKGIMATHGTVVPQISCQGLGASTPMMEMGNDGGSRAGGLFFLSIAREEHEGEENGLGTSL